MYEGRQCPGIDVQCRVPMSVLNHTAHDTNGIEQEDDRATLFEHLQLEVWLTTAHVCEEQLESFSYFERNVAALNIETVVIVRYRSLFLVRQQHVPPLVSAHAFGMFLGLIEIGDGVRPASDDG